MFVGCSDIEQAKRLVAEYVDDPETYVYAARAYYRNVCSVWLAVEPFAVWDGATYPQGEPIPR